MFIGLFFAVLALAIAVSALLAYRNLAADARRQLTFWLFRRYSKKKQNDSDPPPTEEMVALCKRCASHTSNASMQPSGNPPPDLSESRILSKRRWLATRGESYLQRGKGVGSCAACGAVSNERLSSVPVADALTDWDIALEQQQRGVALKRDSPV